MGVLLASRGDMSDPIAGVEPFVPGWLFVLYILAAVGGSIANNVVAYYSSGLCLQSVGLPLRRYQATALDTALSTAMVLYILFVRDFTTVLHDFVALLVVWLAPFAAVWITDGLMRRWRYDAGGDPRRQPAAARTGAGTDSTSRAWVALLAGVAVCAADDQRADLPGAGERAARRRRPHLDARAAGQRAATCTAGLRAGAARAPGRPRRRACRRRACGRCRARGS